MKTPPLYKAETIDGKEVKGFYFFQFNEHYILRIFDSDLNGEMVIRFRIKPETLQIQCKDGEFRPIGEVEIIYFKPCNEMLCPECQEVQCDEDCSNPRETH